MAIGLTKSHVYLIEAEDRNGIGNDFIVDDAGDPDDIDLTNYVEGLDYCEIDFPLRFNKRGVTGAKVPPSPGGAVSADERESARYYVVNVVGTISTRAKALLVDKFLMSDVHVTGASATFIRYHLIFYFGTNDHEQFTDANGNRKSYCTGIVSPDFTIQWDESTPLTKNMNFVFKSVWRK